MAQLQISDESYQTIVTLAQQRDMTPDQFVEAIFHGTIDLEAELETLEVMHDDEAMQAIYAHEAAKQNGQNATISWEQVQRELGSAIF